MLGSSVLHQDPPLPPPPPQWARGDWESLTAWLGKGPWPHTLVPPVGTRRVSPERTRGHSGPGMCCPELSNISQHSQRGGRPGPGQHTRQGGDEGGGSFSSALPPAAAAWTKADFTPPGCHLTLRLRTQTSESTLDDLSISHVSRGHPYPLPSRRLRVPLRAAPSLLTSGRGQSPREGRWREETQQ